MREIATGGVLKEYLRDLEEEPADLIEVDENETGESYGRLLFGWKSKDKRYQMLT
jgi:hypothetical protein